MRKEAAQSLANVMRAHPYLGRAHASCFCGVYPAYDPIGERGIITSLAGKPPALSTVLLTQVTSTPIGNIFSLYPVQIIISHVY